MMSGRGMVASFFRVRPSAVGFARELAMERHLKTKCTKKVRCGMTNWMLTQKLISIGIQGALIMNWGAVARRHCIMPQECIGLPKGCSERSWLVQNQALVEIFRGCKMSQESFDIVCEKILSKKYIFHSLKYPAASR